MTMLVLMLANGWMTRFTKIDMDDGMEIYAPLFILVVCVHIIFGALIFIEKDAYHKYHDFHGIVGVGYIVLKIIMVLIFIYYYT